MIIPNERASQAALVVLLILQAIMLFAMLTKTPPHPPITIPLFGMGPFLGASIGISAAALIMGITNSGSGKLLTGIACILALLSFGPHKYLDPQFPLIWPAVVTAQIAIVILILAVFTNSIKTQIE